MPEKFISFLNADCDANGLPNAGTYTVEVEDTPTLAPLLNGVARRAFVLQNPSPSFTPAAPVSIVAQSTVNVVPTGQTTSLPGTALQNDIILVLRMMDTTSISIPAISGYTRERERSNLQGSGSGGAGVFKIAIDWLRCGASPPTNIVFPDSGGTQDVSRQATHVLILRNVSTSQVFDITVPTERSATFGSANPSMPFDSFTPVTAGSLAILFAGLDDRQASAVSYPSGYTGGQFITVGVDPAGCTSAICSKVIDPAAAQSPDNIVFTASADDGFTLPIVIRPA